MRGLRSVRHDVTGESWTFGTIVLPDDMIGKQRAGVNARSRRLVELFLWAGCLVGLAGAVAGLALAITRWPYPAGLALAGYGIVHSVVFAMLASRSNPKRPVKLQSPQ